VRVPHFAQKELRSRSPFCRESGFGYAVIQRHMAGPAPVAYRTVLYSYEGDLVDEARATLQGSLAPLMSAEDSASVPVLAGRCRYNRADRRPLRKDISPWKQPWVLCAVALAVPSRAYRLLGAGRSSERRDAPDEPSGRFGT